MRRKKLAALTVGGLVAACILCVAIYLFAGQVQVLLSSLMNKRLATINIEMWDEGGEPRVVTSTRLDSSEYDLESITALSILMLTQDQMRRMSSESQDIVEGGLHRVIRRFEAGEIRSGTFTGHGTAARRVGTFRIVVFEGRRPFQMHLPPIILRSYPGWAPGVEQACAVAIPLFVERELARLPGDAQRFVVEGLRRQLDRWEEERPRLGDFSRDWEHLSRWDLRQ